ncbi:MAG: hypothetical protein JWM76_2244 [Pseudonocardiales bacterium]|nr:hypothetical protein [Pseudonocardiales bacterium]
MRANLASGSPIRRTASAAVAFVVMAALGVSTIQTASAAAPSTDRVAARTTLSPGSTIGNSQYQLIMQTDGNLVEYGNGHALWSTGTQSPGASFLVQSDGNAVVYSRAGAALWASRTSGHGDSTLTLQSDGNLILSSASGVTWANMAPGADTLSAGTTLTAGQGLHSADWRFWLIMQADGNLVQYADGRPVWFTSTSGAGSRLSLQTDGNLVVYDSQNAATWSSATFGKNPVLDMQADNNAVIYAAGIAMSLTNSISASSIEVAVFNRMNAERAANNVPPLRWNNSLASSAGTHNLAMSSAGSLSHQLAGEPALYQRITATGFSPSIWAENVAVNTNTSLAGALVLQDLMYNETAPDNGHRINILHPGLTSVGVRVYIDGNHKLWLTEDFGA